MTAYRLIHCGPIAFYIFMDTVLVAPILLYSKLCPAARLICAHDNVFNKAVLGEDAYWFSNADDIARN
jgi:hypothetical protein